MYYKDYLNERKIGWVNIYSNLDIINKALRLPGHLRASLRHISAPPRHLMPPRWCLRALIKHSRSVFI